MNFYCCSCFILADSQFVLTFIAHRNGYTCCCTSFLGKTGESQLPENSIPLEALKGPTSILPAQATSDWICTFRVRSPTSVAKRMLLPSSVSWGRPGEFQESKCDKCLSYLLAYFEGHKSWQHLCRICTDIQVCFTPSTICVHRHKTGKATCPSNIHCALIFYQDISFLEQEGAKPFPCGVQVPKQWTGSHFFFSKLCMLELLFSTLQSWSPWIFLRIRLMPKCKMPVNAKTLFATQSCLCVISERILKHFLQCLSEGDFFAKVYAAA